MRIIEKRSFWWWIPQKSILLEKHCFSRKDLNSAYLRLPISSIFKMDEMDGMDVFNGIYSKPFCGHCAGSPSLWIFFHAAPSLVWLWELKALPSRTLKARRVIPLDTTDLFGIQPQWSLHHSNNLMWVDWSFQFFLASRKLQVPQTCEASGGSYTNSISAAPYWQPNLQSLLQSMFHTAQQSCGPHHWAIALKHVGSGKRN